MSWIATDKLPIPPAIADATMQVSEEEFYFYTSRIFFCVQKKSEDHKEHKY